MIYNNNSSFPVVINKNFKDISAQFFSIFDDISKFRSGYSSLHYEKSIYKGINCDIIYVYYVSPGNKLPNLNIFLMF